MASAVATLSTIPFEVLYQILLLLPNVCDVATLRLVHPRLLKDISITNLVQRKFDPHRMTEEDAWNAIHDLNAMRIELKQLRRNQPIRPGQRPPDTTAQANEDVHAYEMGLHGDEGVSVRTKIRYNANGPAGYLEPLLESAMWRQAIEPCREIRKQILSTVDCAATAIKAAQDILVHDPADPNGTLHSALQEMRWIDSAYSLCCEWHRERGNDNYNGTARVWSGSVKIMVQGVPHKVSVYGSHDSQFHNGDGYCRDNQIHFHIDKKEFVWTTSAGYNEAVNQLGLSTESAPPRNVMLVLIAVCLGPKHFRTMWSVWEYRMDCQERTCHFSRVPDFVSGTTTFRTEEECERARERDAYLVGHSCTDSEDEKDDQSDQEEDSWGGRRSRRRTRGGGGGGGLGFLGFSLRNPR
ncbi:hypothetical protein HKX48_007557 [Thoreauomyces humboldtii]|nr:hypothetical protein HKX48_007557 [Thoreauomyces humboldtii]